MNKLQNTTIRKGEMMIYDSSFDQLRLNMLAEQYLKGSVIEAVSVNIVVVFK